MSVLHYYDNSQNQFHGYLAADPVRGHIPLLKRYGHNRGCFFLTPDNYFFPESVCCVSFIGNVPKDEEELFADTDSFSVATFYTVWACRGNKNGAGRRIINKALNHVRWFKPFVTRVVTLSPKTDMARKFHLSNGAVELRENETTINYEYQV